MKVVIVAKTRMGSGACIGGLTFDGQSVRLIAGDREQNDHFNLEYEIGDVWDVSHSADPDRVAPHVENIIVHEKRKLPPIDNIVAFIERQMPALEGGLELLFGGLVQATSAGVQYVCARTGIPPNSTMFWRPAKTLVRDDDAKRIRYRYPTGDGGRTLTFVGFQEPLEEIPAGTLLRVSLAHWWRPQEMPDGELRCYVQLSGWYLPQESGLFPEPDRPPIPAPTAVPASELSLREAHALLKRVFGYDEFRPLQAEIIEQVLQKKDALAIMPTGSGKSLCYQLPALMFPGLTLVVSPLISLMEDQVQQLRQLGVPAVFLNSTLNYEAYLQNTRDIRSGRVKLLYAAPETLLRPETLLMLEQCQVDCLTIDEAHCISQWGHDFRPEYRQLLNVRQRLAGAACLAVTATATSRVRDDIKHTLRIPRAGEFVASFDRPNLLLAARQRVDGLQETIALLRKHRGEAGIIYCSTRKTVDELAQKLQASGWPALAYHAGLDDALRTAHQRRFTHEEGLIIVATVAFGMGIDKSNVRFVLHYNLPQDLESYYQQIGRAGRDGLEAECLLLYGTDDVHTINFFIDRQDKLQRAGAAERLQAMLRFCETTQCRRRPLLSYFGERYEAESCDMCDNCQTPEEETLADLTVLAQKFLSCVKRTGELFGAAHVIDVLRGSQAKRVLARRHHELSTYGIGRELSKKEWQYLARQFVELGLLKRDAEHGSLSLTPQAYAVFRGEQVLGVLPAQEMAEHARGTRQQHDQALFELLRQKRAELAQDEGVPPYLVFSDRTLVEMATYFPQSWESLADIYGVGEVKLARYAPSFLPLIQDYCGERDIQERRRLPEGASPLTLPTRERTKAVIEAFHAGRTMAEIAHDLGVKERTVINHLWKHVEAGNNLCGRRLLEISQLSPQEQKQALDAFAEHGTAYLKPVFEALGERISYEELAIMRLYAMAGADGRG